MAKKSAYSKGYRKTAKAKPFLTKKEIIALIVIVAAILLGIVLFNLFYDDGYLGADEIQANDIVYYASSDLRDRYIKMGTANELEGFTMEGLDTSNDDVVLRRNYTPNEPVDSLDYFTVSASFVNASGLVNTNYAYLASDEMLKTIELSEIQETTVQGYPAYTYSYHELETEETAAEGDGYSQGISTFVQVADDRTVCLYIYLNNEDASAFVPDDQILEYVEKYSAAFTLDQAAE